MNGAKLYHGGLSFHSPGTITHSGPEPHVHHDQEAYCLLQGEGWVEIDGKREPVQAGDVIIVDPGEDHRLISSEHNPLINLWLHADDKGNPKQF